MSDSLLDSLRSAVAASPQDHVLRLHLAALLIDHGLAAEALQHVSAVLAADAASVEALALLGRATTALGVASPPAAVEAAADFDWGAAESQVGDLVPPMFATDTPDGPVDIVDRPERPTVRLADVGGLDHVKERLELAFLAPLRNPELRTLYAKSLRGGLLLYGPPGCGKTFLARAVAGELGAAFFSISLADVLDMYIGQSERNIAKVFETVRQHAPAVLFLDEVDAIGMKRSEVRGAAMRGAINQLLTELDDVNARNDGVFVLAATNAPWDLDSALRRPGRLDRTLLVLPPDEVAREAILRYHVKDRPIAEIDLPKLVRSTDGFSGADLAHLCDTAAEQALLDSARSGKVRMITMKDFTTALKQVKPSTGPWFTAARNVAMFSNPDGDYDELVEFLRRTRRL